MISKIGDISPDAFSQDSYRLKNGNSILWIHFLPIKYQNCAISMDNASSAFVINSNNSAKNNYAALVYSFHKELQINYTSPKVPLISHRFLRDIFEPSLILDFLEPFVKEIKYSVWMALWGLVPTLAVVFVVHVCITLNLNRLSKNC